MRHAQRSHSICYARGGIIYQHVTGRSRARPTRQSRHRWPFEGEIRQHTYAHTHIPYWQEYYAHIMRSKCVKQRLQLLCAVCDRADCGSPAPGTLDDTVRGWEKGQRQRNRYISNGAGPVAICCTFLSASCCLRLHSCGVCDASVQLDAHRDNPIGFYDSRGVCHKVERRAAFYKLIHTSRGLPCGDVDHKTTVAAVASVFRTHFEH